MRRLFFVAAFILCAGVWAHTISGKVVKVLDGNCLVVKDDKGKLHIVRMSGIDAPVKGQRYFRSAMASLKRLSLGKQVTVDWDVYDPYCAKAHLPRAKCWKIGRVIHEGNDLNLAQVSRGYAWHSVFREDEQTTADRTLYSEAEAKARRRRLGLWKDKKPVPPWEFARRRGLSPH